MAITFDNTTPSYLPTGTKVLYRGTDGKPMRGEVIGETDIKHRGYSIIMFKGDLFPSIVPDMLLTIVDNLPG